MVSSDFAVIVHRLAGRSIKVYAIGDVHIGAAECDMDGFARFLIVRIVLGKHGMHDHYALLLVHGKSDVARRRFEYTVEGVDAIVSGHVHKGNISKPARIVLSTRNQVSIKPLVSLVATSWTDYGGYAARGLMLPAATSDPQALLLEFAGTNKRDGQIRVIW